MKRTTITAMLLIAAVLFGSIQMPAVSYASQVVTTAEAAEDGQTPQDGTVSDPQAQADQEDQDTGDSKDQNSTSTSKKKSSTKKTTKSYTEKQLRLMAAIINCEAGAESYQGKLAVGIVIMNRIRSKSFPNTLSGVIYQSGQFSPVRNGALKRRLAQYDASQTGSAQWKACIKAAKEVLNGRNYLTINGKKKDFTSFHFFSVYLSGARFRLGGHRFK